MDINLTLFGEMLTFATLVWVMMKYIWPPLMEAIAKRQDKITSGLEAAERSKYELELTRANITEQLQQTKGQIARLLAEADKQAIAIITKGKALAETERDNIFVQTRISIAQEEHKAKHTLQQYTVELVVAGIEKVLQQKLDDSLQKSLQKRLIDQLISSV